MKKRILSLLMALCMAVPLLAAPAAAAPAVTTFSDVPDRETAVAVECLRLMGVLDGFDNNTFRPEGSLTRAQFCKMAVYAMNGSGELGRYRTVTVFPDVKPSHWAAAYINMAA
ncbi:MAG: S-layer homology domain-containing protein, partial [Oscillibacter sp.]